MTLRNEWEFEYAAGEVADAAVTQANVHADRMEWWEHERESVVQQLKESGLEVTEYEVTGGARHDVQFDPKLTKRLSECQNKISSHGRDEARYRMFARVLGEHRERRLQLHPEDVDYFRLAG